MEKRFKEGQLVKLIGGTRKMRVVSYETIRLYKRNALLGAIVKDTGELTGRIFCGWISNDREMADYFEEYNLEICDIL